MWYSPRKEKRRRGEHLRTIVVRRGEDVFPPLSIGRGIGTIEKEEGVGERKNRKGEKAAIKPAEE